MKTAPPASDEWRPKHTARKKPFGIEITYTSQFRLYKARLISWKQWYATDAARKIALEAWNKKKNYIAVEVNA